MNDFLKIENLNVTFGKDTVIKDFNLTIPKNAITVFWGPSGSGKTTVLRSISGLNRYAKGRIFLDGQDISELPVHKRNIGVIFQSYALFPNMTVFDNVAYGLRAQKLSKDEIYQEVTTMLQLVNLESKANNYPDDLSGGQKQRVAIARSMVMKPKLLLLDEPLSALDAKIRVELREQIREYQQKLGITMIFVTRDQGEAMAIADNVVVISDGKIQQQGSPWDIYTKPVNEFMATFIGEHNILSGQELANLGINELSKEEKYLIRPESITLKKISELSDQEVACLGKIDSVVNYGNRVQYTISKNNLSLKMEALNHTLPLVPETEIEFFIDKSKILPLS